MLHRFEYRCNSHQFISLFRARRLAFQWDNISHHELLVVFCWNQFLQFCCHVFIELFFKIALRQILLICRRYAVFWSQRSSLQNAKQKGADSLVCQDHFTFNFTISRVNLEQLIVHSRKYSCCGWNSHWLLGFLMFSDILWEQVYCTLHVVFFVINFTCCYVLFLLLPILLSSTNSISKQSLPGESNKHKPK